METRSIYPLESKSTDVLSKNQSYGNQNTTVVRAKTAVITNHSQYDNRTGIDHSTRVAWQANESKSKTVMFHPVTVQDNNGSTTIYNLDSTNRSLPTNYGSSALQPLNPNQRNLVGGDPYTAYQSDRGHGPNSKYSVIRDSKGANRSSKSLPNSSTQEPPHAYRGANSAPGVKKPDRSRPLPKINSLVRTNDPDPLEKHLRKPAGTSTYKNGQAGTSTKSQDPSARNWAQIRGEKGKGTPNENSLETNIYRGDRKRDRESTPPPPKESLVKPPKTSRTIYFGPNASHNSKVQQDRDEHGYRQMGLGVTRDRSMPRMQRKGTSFYRSRPDDANTTVTFKSDRETTIMPRRERTRANVNRARSELISRAKTKDDVRLRRTRNFVAVPVDSSRSKKEKIDRDIYRLEEQMNIYLQSHGINMNATEFDTASRMTGATMNTSFGASRAGSPKKKKRNPYTDPKSKVPPWHRKEYILNKREADMYQHVSKVYGNEKLRRLREENFYKKVEALQLEQWHRLWDEYEKKLKERDNARKRHLHQLKNVRDKYTDDRWERIAKFPVNRIPIHDEDNRHDYGLPVDINEDPEAYVPRVGELHKPKETFNSDTQNTKNVKRWYPIFRGYRKVKYDAVKHPKMEGVDVVVLSDEDDDQNMGPDGKRQKKKKVKVTSLVKDAENALEGASDDSEWEDVEDAEELNRRLRKSTKTPADLNQTGPLNNRNARTNKYQRSTAPTNKFGAYGTTVGTKKPSHNTTGSLYGQGRTGRNETKSVTGHGPQSQTQNAYRPQGNSRFKTSVGDFRNKLGKSDLDQRGKPVDAKKNSRGNNQDTHGDTPNQEQDEQVASNKHKDGADNVPKDDKDNSDSTKNNLHNPSMESVAKSVQNDNKNLNNEESTDQNGSNNDSMNKNDKGKNTDNKNKEKVGTDRDSLNNANLNKNLIDENTIDGAANKKDDSNEEQNKKDKDKKEAEKNKNSKEGKDNKSQNNMETKETDQSGKDGQGNAEKDKLKKEGKVGEENQKGKMDEPSGKDAKDKQSETDDGKTKLEKVGKKKDEKDQKENDKDKDSKVNSNVPVINGDDNAAGNDSSTNNKDDDKLDNQKDNNVDKDNSIDKENQAPKKQVRIISPEKPAPKTTRAVSPGIGKNRGSYKVPKKFEIQKSDKQATRPESPSLFNKGLYHEPKKFEVKKSDKDLTKAQGPDLGHGEYEAPKPYEITKTERTIRRVKSPFSERERGTYQPRTPETHKRRTTRTDRDTETFSQPGRGGRRTVGHRPDENGSRKPNRRDQRHTDGDILNNSRIANTEGDGGRGGRKTRKEVTDTTITRRRKPGGYGDEEDDDYEYGNRSNKPKPKQTRKPSPKRKESKTKPNKGTSFSQDPNRPDIPTPDLDTDDDDDDIFERAKRKYGIVLDDSD